MNDELSQRSLELNEVNFFLERMLGAMDPGVVVDGHQKVQVWNSGSAELWSVRPDGAHGQRLWGLDIGLPIDGVRTAAPRGPGRAPGARGRRARRDQRRGRAMPYPVSCVPVGANDGAASGASLVIDPLQPEGAAASDGDG